MNIPQLDSCRFISLSQLRDRIKTDTFSYKSVRVTGKIVNLQNDKGFTLIRQPDWQLQKGDMESDDDCDLQVNTFFVRDRTLEVNKVYEFLGEVEEVSNSFVLYNALNRTKADLLFSRQGLSSNLIIFTQKYTRRRLLTCKEQ
jgi:hypothetical protein